jgi:hypothetical protein
MNPASEAGPLRRLPLMAAGWGALIAGAILLFTMNTLYSIISLAAAAMAIAGFYLMVQRVNLLIYRGRGKAGFFAVGVAKLALIALAFYGVSRISEGAVLAFVAGISVLPLALMSEGAWQLVRSISHGRA